MFDAASLDGREPGQLVATLGLMLLGALGVFKAVRWLLSGPAKPDPWDEVDADAMRRADHDDCILCHHCLVPNAQARDFCENCGAPIGTYTNFLPFPQLFSVGYVLRLGTAGEFKRNKLTVFGYVLLAATQYLWFAPIYLYQFFRTGERAKPTATQG